MDGYADTLLCARCLPRHAKSSAGFCRKCVNAVAIFSVGIFCGFIMILYLFRRVRSAMRRNTWNVQEHGDGSAQDSPQLFVLPRHPHVVSNQLSQCALSTVAGGRAISSLQSDALSVECLLSDDFDGSKYLLKNVFALIMPLGGIAVSGVIWMGLYACLRRRLSREKKDGRRRRRQRQAYCSKESCSAEAIYCCKLCSDGDPHPLCDASISEPHCNFHDGLHEVWRRDAAEIEGRS